VIQNIDLSASMNKIGDVEKKFDLTLSPTELFETLLDHHNGILDKANSVIYQDSYKGPEYALWITVLIGASIKNRVPASRTIELEPVPQTELERINKKLRMLEAQMMTMIMENETENKKDKRVYDKVEVDAIVTQMKQEVKEEVHRRVSLDELNKHSNELQKNILANSESRFAQIQDLSNYVTCQSFQTTLNAGQFVKVPDLNSTLQNYCPMGAFNTKIAQVMNKGDAYSKAESDAKNNTFMTKGESYTKAESDAKNNTFMTKGEAYTKAESVIMNNTFATKAESYTRAEIDAKNNTFMTKPTS